MAKITKATPTETTSKINPDLMMLAKPIASLRPDDRNARTHKEKDLGVIARSLDTYGQQKPIVVLTDGKVIAGNGTLAAAKSLGWTHIACVTFDNEDEAKARAFAIVDNRSSDLSGWDFDILSSELVDLSAVGLEVGFTTVEIERLVSSTAPPTTDVSKHSRELHIEAGNTTCPKCGFEFDT
jgi:ParB-like chromosome segregation protein Spo0J